MTDKTIRVRMATGLTMPLPRGQAIDSTVRKLTDETVVTVKVTRWTRRRLKAGDLVEVKDAPKRTERPAAPAKAES